MQVAAHANDPVVLSYLTLRKAVGVIALALPFVLAIPWWFLRHSVAASISSYYYTGMRNLFVGSLCAISMFMLCCRGYDRQDERAGMFGALCALGVAFCPTTPDSGASSFQAQVGIFHYVFAALLFSTLAYFCLVLFKMTAADKRVTRKKLQRNQVYTVCGWAIIVSVLLIILLTKIIKVEYLVWDWTPTFCFESTALMAFGFAWLTKGETWLKDESPVSATQRSAAPGGSPTQLVSP